MPRWQRFRRILSKAPILEGAKFAWEIAKCAGARNGTRLSQPLTLCGTMAWPMHREIMKTIRVHLTRPAASAVSAILVAGALSVSAVRATALDNPINPNAPSPNSGVAPGHRAAGDFAARRSGFYPTWRGQSHSYTGITKDTP